MIEKCEYCAGDIKLSPAPEREYLKYCGRYYHRDCFIEKMLDSNINVVRTSVEEYADELVKKYKATETFKQDRNKLLKWLKSQYQLSKIPHSLYDKLMSVFIGTYDGLNEKRISPSELLDMWQQKIPELETIHITNEKKGRHIKENMLPYYDLSILVNMYDDYLKWKYSVQSASNCETTIDNSLPQWKSEFKTSKSKITNYFNWLDNKK